MLKEQIIIVIYFINFLLLNIILLPKFNHDLNKIR
jgi:hypothetical protein